MTTAATPTTIRPRLLRPPSPLSPRLPIYRPLPGFIRTDLPNPCEYNAPSRQNVRRYLRWPGASPELPTLALWPGVVALRPGVVALWPGGDPPCPGAVPDWP